MAKLLEMGADKFENVLVKCLTEKMTMNDFEYHLVDKPDGNDLNHHKVFLIFITRSFIFLFSKPLSYQKSHRTSLLLT